MKLGPQPITLRQLQYAVAVADLLSFRRAAEACLVSQPSLSAQLSELESALGVRLFERDRRRVLITPAGHELLVRARRVLLEAEDLLEAARALGDPLSGTLRLGVIPTVSPYLLPEATPLLRERHPRLTLAWVEEKTAELVARVTQGALEGALVALESDLGGLERAVIAEEAFVLAMPPEHRLARGTAALSLGDLEGSQVLLLDEGHCLREQALSLCVRAGAREGSFRATSLSTLAQMVAGGAGVTLLPRLAVEVERRRARLARRNFARPAPHRTLALCWRKRSPLAPALLAVAETLRLACASVARAARVPPAPRRA
jgi:LysR family hydrogen peroxide-inducible transcriptional activator